MASHFKNLLAVCMLMLPTAPAFAVDEIDDPYIEKGSAHLEYLGGFDFDHRDAHDNAQGHQFEFGASPTDWWRTAVNAQLARDPGRGGNTDLAAFEWENGFALTKPNEYWLDAGVSESYVHTVQGGEPDVLEGKILLAKKAGPFTTLFNAILDKEVGPGAGHDVSFGVAAGTRYDFSENFGVGVELHSDLGLLGHSEPFSQQQHVIGPAIYGSLSEHINYDVGAFAGLTSGSPDFSVRTDLQYAWKF